MTLHIFNPEHDIALAAGQSNFTAPHAGRLLRHDLGFLPLIWAQEGDSVLVDDVEYGKKVSRRFSRTGITLLSPADLKTLEEAEISPWGWDPALRAQLLRKGVPSALLPTMEQVDGIRQLSHRRTAAALLPHLRVDGTVGEMWECTHTEEIEALAARHGKLVLKAPWSSSGRGLRFLDAGQTSIGMHAGWIKNVLAAQGSVMAEPLYNKVKDFGMEFVSDGNGGVAYLGLSLFHTKNGAYTGNVLATETAKELQLTRYLPITLLRQVQLLICQHLGRELCGKYKGPFGIDMMVVAKGQTTDNRQLLLHPCVEINLRRTMGHVAIDLTRRLNPQEDDELVRVMRIAYEENHYKLKIQRP